ncbi:MAG: hypothetical protein ACFN38_07535 [Campylobacter sp.]
MLTPSANTPSKNRDNQSTKRENPSLGTMFTQTSRFVAFTRSFVDI